MVYTKITANCHKIMSKVSPANTIFLHGKRAFSSVGAEAVKVMNNEGKKNVAESSACLSGKREEVYWMRDPKTGYWMPETHFGEVDVVDLREKYLSKNETN